MAEDHGGGGGGFSDVMFILIVLLTIVGMYYFSGAPKAAGINTVFMPFPGQRLATGTYPTIGVPGVQGLGGTFDTTETKTITGEVAALNRDVDSLKNVPNSNYAGKVTISAPSDGRSTLARQEYIVLEASSKNTKPITISGWRLESTVSEHVAYIRDGTELYQQGNAVLITPIILKPGEEAIIATGRSPVGISFKTNKCSGYLAQFQTFAPKFDDCPRPEDDLNLVTNKQLFADNDCYHHLEKLSACRIDLSPPNTLSPLCKDFIYNRITYQGCVIAHRFDSDFTKAQWRVFLGYDYPLWRSEREAIALIDENGKVVDSVIY